MNVVSLEAVRRSLLGAPSPQAVRARTISEKIVEWGCSYADEAFMDTMYIPELSINAKRDIWRGGLRRLRAALRKELGADATADMKAAVAEEALEVYRGRYVWDEERMREIRALNATSSGP